MILSGRLTRSNVDKFMIRKLLDFIDYELWAMRVCVWKIRHLNWATKQSNNSLAHPRNFLQKIMYSIFSSHDQWHSLHQLLQLDGWENHHQADTFDHNSIVSVSTSIRHLFNRSRKKKPNQKAYTAIKFKKHAQFWWDNEWHVVFFGFRSSICELSHRLTSSFSCKHADSKDIVNSFVLPFLRAFGMWTVRNEACTSVYTRTYNHK